MDIRTLQLTLEDIYEVRTEHNIEQFVFSDGWLADRLDQSGRNIPEKLLVHEDEEGLSLSLYLDAEMLNGLAADNPLERLHHDNLADYCTVLEGVSHFVYLIWNASHDRPVTQLEMEIQAEIDKYISSVALFAQQSDGRIPVDLCERLFDNVQFDSQLDAQEYQRYTLANDYAARYCRKIHDHLLRVGDSVTVTREIRRFYRLIRQQKIRYIENLPTRH